MYVLTLHCQLRLRYRRYKYTRIIVELFVLEVQYLRDLGVGVSGKRQQY